MKTSLLPKDVKVGGISSELREAMGLSNFHPGS